MVVFLLGNYFDFEYSMLYGPNFINYVYVKYTRIEFPKSIAIIIDTIKLTLTKYCHLQVWFYPLSGHSKSEASIQMQYSLTHSISDLIKFKII